MVVHHGSVQKEYEKKLDNYLQNAEKTGQRPSLLKAIEEPATEEEDKVIAGRTYREIVIDDLVHMMITVMRDVPDPSPIIPSYKKLVTERFGQNADDAKVLESFQSEQKFAQNNKDQRQNFLPAHIAMLYNRLSQVEVHEATMNWLHMAEDTAMLISDDNNMDAAVDAYGELRAAVERDLERIDKGAPQIQNETTTKNASKNMDMNGNLAKLLENFCENLTEKATKQDTDQILYRSEEIRQVKAAMMKDKNAFALCVGPNGACKSTVAEGLADNIINNQVPEKLKGAAVYRLKARELKMKSEKGLVSDLQNIVEGISQHNSLGKEQIILDLNELTTMDDRMPMFQGRDVLANAIENYPHLRIIGEISDLELPALQKEFPKMMDSFQTVKVKPLSDKQTLSLLKDKVAGTELQNTEENTLKRIIQLTNRYTPEVKQPGAALEVLNTAKAYAELDGAEISENHVIEAIANKADLPKEMIGGTISDRIAVLGEKLPKMVLGQDEAINKIVGNMKVANAGLHDPNKPLGSFMLVGPTGVGKTETAKALADSLGVPLITEDMGNYQEQHAKAKLIGSPPGYLGFGQEAALEKVAKVPYSVLLLDEIEKAHGDVLNVLLSVLDEGRVQLMNGKDVDFKNCIVLMTSNLGEADAQFAKEKNRIGFNAASSDAQKEEKEAAADEVRQEAIKKRLPPEFINRLDGILKYNSLQKAVAKNIAKNKVEKVSAFLQDKNHNLSLTISKKALDQLVDAGYDERYGARPMDRAIKDLIKEPLAEWIVENSASITEPVTLNIKQVTPKFQLDVKKAAGAAPAP